MLCHSRIRLLKDLIDLGPFRSCWRWDAPGIQDEACCQIPSYKAILPRMTYRIQVSLAQFLFGFVKIC